MKWSIIGTSGSTVIMGAPPSLRTDRGLRSLCSLLKRYAREHTIKHIVIYLHRTWDVDNTTVDALAVAACIVQIEFDAKLWLAKPNEKLQRLISSRELNHLLVRCDS